MTYNCVYFLRKNGVEILSEVVYLKVMPPVEWFKRDTMGVIGIFALSPHYSGDVVTLDVFVNTDFYNLNFWWLDIDFDTDVLSALTFSEASNFFLSICLYIFSLEIVLRKLIVPNSCLEISPDFEIILVSAGILLSEITTLV